MAITFVLPESGNQVYDNLQSQEQYSTKYRWVCPTGDGHYTYEVLEMEISKSDFDNSLKRNTLRSSTVFDPVPLHFIEPNDPYVKKVAEHILEKTEGMSDYDRATAALYFVQSSIDYYSDDKIYGTSEFWAYPVETLFLKKGDCEDTTILLSSIYSAMGIKCALLDYENHEAVAFDIGGGYIYCETASDSIRSPTGRNLSLFGEQPKIHPVGDNRDYFRVFDQFIAGYRNLIYNITGL